MYNVNIYGGPEHYGINIPLHDPLYPWKWTVVLPGRYFTELKAYSAQVVFYGQSKARVEAEQEIDRLLAERSATRISIWYNSNGR